MKFNSLFKRNLLGLIVLAAALALVASPGWGGRLSPASLDLDTCGCPTTFEPPTCNRTTSWSIDKTTPTETLTDPNAAPFIFDVTVTEGPTSHRILTVNGMIVVTNSGEQDAYLSSLALTLEDLWEGNPKDNPYPAFGPSGASWTILATAAQSKEEVCGSTAVTCFGELVSDSPKATLTLFTDVERNDVVALSDAQAIPPTIDNDGDGLRDEDPEYTGFNDTANSCGIIDNDGDGKFDEDPIDGIDNDGDCPGDTNGDLTICGPGDEGVDEDGPDDDGDNSPLSPNGDGSDEDGACQDAVVFYFTATFDLDALKIADIVSTTGDGLVPSADDLRVNLQATFGAGGSRGATCKADINCNGKKDEGEDYVRTIQQRYQFDPVPCGHLCDEVKVTDVGAAAADETCVDVVTETNTANGAVITATETEGTKNIFNVSGNVSCINGECGTTVKNTATLSGNGCDGLIEPSEATASFDVECSGGFPPVGTGDFCSQTQGGWGNECKGNNPGCLRDTYFGTFFPNGLCIGDNWDTFTGQGTCIDGDGRYAIYLGASTNVQAYLPAGGTPAALTADQTNPTSSTSSGVFGGQLVAATLNVVFDANGVGLCTLTGTCDFGYPPGTLGNLVYKEGCVAAKLVGVSVNQVIAWSNCAISGEDLATCGVPEGITIPDLSDALAKLNENFVDCDTNEGCLEFTALPPTEVCADFTKFAAGASVEGPDTVLPGLTISTPTGGAVALFQGQQPTTYGAPNTACGKASILSGCVDATGGFGDVNAKNSVAAHSYTFSFAAPVSEFSLRMLDYGDYNPKKRSQYSVAMTAYDADNAVVGEQLLQFNTQASTNPRWSDFGDLLCGTGDACDATPGQPGNYTWRVVGSGITKVTLIFDGAKAYDPNIGFDTLCLVKE